MMMRRSLAFVALVAAAVLACAPAARAAVPSNGNYIVQSDPGTVAGILVGFTLLSILGIGLCCLGEIARGCPGVLAMCFVFVGGWCGACNNVVLWPRAHLSAAPPRIASRAPACCAPRTSFSF